MEFQIQVKFLALTKTPRGTTGQVTFSAHYLNSLSCKTGTVPAGLFKLQSTPSRDYF